MKKLLMLVLGLALASNAVQAAAPPGPGPNNPCLLQPPASDLVLDVNNLPAKVELTLGQSVVFVRKNLPVGPSVQVSFSTNGTVDPLEKLNTAAVVRKGHQVVAVFQAKAEGNGELILNSGSTASSAQRKAVPFTVQGVAASSGVEGNVSAGPTTPVARPGEKDTKAVGGALITVEDENGKEVARTTADVNGNFKVNLPPGKYKVIAKFPNQKTPFPLPSSKEVVVPKQGYQKLELQLDTGIRTPVMPEKKKQQKTGEFNIEVERKLLINGEQ